MTLATRISIAVLTLAVSMLVFADTASACPCASGGTLSQEAFEVGRVQRAGRLRGMLLLQSGEPAGGVRVELVSADDDDTNWRFVRAVSADAAGRFQFQQVAPGRYFVGVDISGRHEGPFVFPATFHPGTPDRTLATVIDTEGAGSQELAPMVLPAHRVPFTLTGRAVYEDGRPATGANVVLAKGDGRGELVSPIAAGDDGTFEFTVYEGLAYLVRAYYSVDDNAAGVGGESEPFVVAGAPAPVTVVVRSRR